jgi:hypothetical protein
MGSRAPAARLDFLEPPPLELDRRGKLLAFATVDQICEDLQHPAGAASSRSKNRTRGSRTGRSVGRRHASTAARSARCSRCTSKSSRTCSRCHWKGSGTSGNSGVAPLLDRLMHHGHLLKFDGRSWRNLTRPRVEDFDLAPGHKHRELAELEGCAPDTDRRLPIPRIKDGVEQFQY